MIFLQLFIEFFKTGLFSVGGGMATIPFLQDMAVKTHWFTSAQLADMIAVAESTPGPLGVNMATYVGYTIGSSQMGLQGGILGAILATLGLVTPSIIVISIIAYFLEKFRKNKYVEAAFYGLRPASVALIAAAGISIICISLFNANDILHLFSEFHVNYKHIILAAIILIFTRWVPKTKKLHPLYFIVFSGIIGVIFNFSSY